MMNRQSSVEILQNAIKEIKETEEALSVGIHNKRYITVANRIGILRKHFGTRATLTTKVMENTDNTFDSEGKLQKSGKVIIKTNIFIDRELVSTGLAEEYRAASSINKTSALENCETSSVGRALSFLGLTNSEVASAEEVTEAKKKQNKKPDESPTTISEVKSRFINAKTMDDLNGIVNEPQVRELFINLKGSDKYKKLAAIHQQKQKELTKGENNG